MTTNLQSLMHFIKGMIGAGLFSMGIAFKNGGIIFALIFTPLIGLLVLHCLTILVRSIEKTKEKKGPPISQQQNEHADETYADIVTEIFLSGPPIVKRFAKYVGIAVNSAICFMNLGFCCVYIVFVGNNMGKVLQYFDVHFSIYVLMLIFIVPIWLSALITNLNWLAPVSMFANTLLLTALVITMYYICQGLQDFASLGYVGQIDTIPLFVSVALYSFDIVALVVPLRNEMDHPEKITSIFNVGLSIIIPVIVAMGFFSYFKYGNEIQGTIFLNLPQDDLLVQVLLVLVCVQVLFSYPVQLYAPVTIMWPMVQRRFGPFKRPLPLLLCFRTCLVLLTLAISEAIPFIDLIIALIGAVCSTYLTLFIPALLDIIVNYQDTEKSTLPRIYLVGKNCLIAVLAVSVFITGIYTSVRDIINSF